MTTSTMRRPRQLRHAPLVMAVAAAVICTAAGTSTATEVAPASADTPQSGSAYTWYLLNHTGQPIYGTWSAEMASGDKSHVDVPADGPLKPDEAAPAIQYASFWRYTTWTGHICYNKHWWNYTHSSNGYDDLGSGPNISSLEVASTGALFVYPHGGDRAHRFALTLRPDLC